MNCFFFFLKKDLTQKKDKEKGISKDSIERKIKNHLNNWKGTWGSVMRYSEYRKIYDGYTSYYVKPRMSMQPKHESAGFMHY